MFPEPTELLLVGFSIQSIWIPRSKSNTATPKNQLADILTKVNFTRDEWNHLLTLSNISHFRSTACIAAMAKRAHQESGEGRVTAKSRPMMNLTARTPSFVSSSTSNPGMTSYVNTIHPEPEIHEHFMIHKGYGTLCTTSSTFSPTLRPL